MQDPTSNLDRYAATPKTQDVLRNNFSICVLFHPGFDTARHHQPVMMLVGKAIKMRAALEGRSWHVVRVQVNSN